MQAVLDQEVYEIKSAYILQPGPAALTDGLDQVYATTSAWRERHQDKERPKQKTLSA